ncbi:lectin-like domain-containing protein [Companilactobacillus keshanensis]|uniref:Cell surface protein n=1 Tax=Companilactobacillus keshanensis TaxID=2486003 RepID=A0ABW4BVH1_9LACO|nr:hypothetical protein [Companilactobacillus keshanensis]
MNKNVKLRYIWVISTVILIGIFLNNSQNVYAVDEYNDPTDNAPTGLNFSDYFMKGNVSTNSANTTTYKNGNTSIVQVTGTTKKQQGYVWSNPDSLNYLNLKERQTLSMWIYLGHTDAPADGLAFVLQNYGSDAAARTKSGGQAIGQTMGVWGDDDNYQSSTTPSEIAAKGIQNSWALEFDTFANNLNTGAGLFKDGLATDASYVGNSSFDSLINVGDGDSHIAYNYPGDPGTYVQQSDSTARVEKPGIFGSTYTNVQTYWYSMIHNGLVKTPDKSSNNLKLSNGMWHHVVVSYLPPDAGSTIGHLSYIFDDKVKSQNSSSIPEVKEPVSRSNIDIDTSEFYKNSKQQFSKDVGKVLWGFTGTTGVSYARNMVVFESIPSLVEGSASATIYDDSQAGKELTTSDDSVYNGDNMRFVYNVKRDSGEMDWKGINATINLPDNMTYNGGTIAYSDGTTENIGATDLSSGAFTKTLKDLLKSGDPNSATITINGVTNSSTPASDKTVASTTADFDGTDLIKNVDMQGFTIKATTMKLTPDIIDLDIGSKPSIAATATASYADTSVVMNNSKVTAHYKINDGTEKTQSLSNGSDGKVSINISKTDLNDGANTVVAYVTDTDGNRSNSVTYTINKPTPAPILIDADSEMSFRTVHSNGKNQTVKRNGSWKVNVVDNDGNSNWKLDATAVQDSSSDTFDGDLLYVDNTGVTQSILNGSIIQIADKSTFPSNYISDGTTYQIANTWDNDDGMLLKSNADAKAGNYKYDVTWDLTDSI